MVRDVGAAASSPRKPATKRGGSVTDQFESPAEKLAFRMNEGMFSVIDLADVSEPSDASFAAVKGLLATRSAYAVKPGQGGNRYLTNIASRLQACGFVYDGPSGVWLFPKLVDGVERQLDMTTLQIVGGAKVAGPPQQPPSPVVAPLCTPTPAEASMLMAEKEYLEERLEDVGYDPADEIRIAEIGKMLAARPPAASKTLADMPAAAAPAAASTHAKAPSRQPAAAATASSSLLTSTRLSPENAQKVVHAAAPKRAAPLAMPPRLSPTAVSAFRECQQLFLFRNMWKLPEPASPVLTKGILVHSALEHIFAYPPAERSDRLHDLLRDEWRESRKKPEHADLFASRDEERKWGLECLHLLDNYMRFDDPANPRNGEPVAVEAWLSAELRGGGEGGGVGGAGAVGGQPVKLVGKVDRLDLHAGRDGLMIVDYKTGKAPKQIYSQAVNERIRRDAFFQLRCYALLLARGGAPQGYDASRAAPVARGLRLLYLADGVDGGATALDDELPLDDAAYNAVLDATEAEILGVWQELQTLVALGDARAFSHCSRSFCACHDLRPLVFPEQDEEDLVWGW